MHIYREDVGKVILTNDEVTLSLTEEEMETLYEIMYNAVCSTIGYHDQLTLSRVCNVDNSIYELSMFFIRLENYVEICIKSSDITNNNGLGRNRENDEEIIYKYPIHSVEQMIYTLDELKYEYSIY